MLINQIESMKPVNLFLGAGISKLAPAYAPIWREMQLGFCEALFDRMKLEKWDLKDVEPEIEALRRFNFRPETFWERILGRTSLKFVSSALSIVNLGKPNLNHTIIAEMCNQGIVRNVITTNFDEYLDNSLPHGFRRIVSQKDLPTANQQRVYFKVHGTISSSESLQFTLQHTKKLPEWKSELLEGCLEGIPLVVVGYSGWDDDLMPRLLGIAAHIPKIIVVRYPGASKDEPVNALAQFSQTEIIEADFSKEIQKWCDQNSKKFEKILKHKNPLSGSKAPDGKSFYSNVLTKLSMPVIPFLASQLFELAANRDYFKRYAWLAEDACDDPRYEGQVSDEFKRQVKVALSMAVAPKDAEMSKLLMEQANENYPDQSAPIAHSTMENIDRVFEYFFGGELTPEQEREIEQYAGGALKMREIGMIHGAGIQFRAGWCMGRLRKSQNRLAEAVDYYTQAVKDIPDTLEDVQKCSFYLDCGLAAFYHSVPEQDDKLLATAIGVLEESERIAVNINDHLTAAKAMMNLSNCYALCGKPDLAMQKVKRAQELARLTGDQGLQQRSMELEGKIRELIEELR